MAPTVASTVGRLGRFAGQAAGMRTTRPACSSASTSLRQPHRLVRRPAQRMEDLAGVDDLLQPGAAFAGAADRLEQLQEFGLGAGAGVFAQRSAERRVAQRAVGGEPRGVGGEKGERPLGVLAVLGEVEMHAADDAASGCRARRETRRRRGRSRRARPRRLRRATATAPRGAAASRYSPPRIGGASSARRAKLLRGAARRAPFPRRRTAPRRTAWRRRARTPGPAGSATARLGEAELQQPMPLPRARTPLRAARRPRRRAATSASAASSRSAP